MFRPCIDLRGGKVVQIVGGSLTDSGAGVQTNFEAAQPPRWFAEQFRKDDLRGGHVIALGPGNEGAARETLAAWPGGLQFGGGVNADNAPSWLEAGASHVIVTSWIFREGRLDWERLREINARIGPKRLVLDLSCRKRHGCYWVVTDRWQTFTDLAVVPATFDRLAGFCSEFLVHAVDVEGLCRGIDLKLVGLLAEGCPLPSTYAGGAKSLADLETVHRLGRGRVDLTIGSALDVFGGNSVAYEDCVAFNRLHRPDASRQVDTKSG